TWIHDALTIACALDSSIADFDECYADVICDSSLARGMSWRCFREPKMSMGVDLSTKNCVKILKNVDNARLLKLIKERLLKGVCYENYESITT
ncbi:nucleoside hydrolase, partial [Campylobacter jejuni]|nr:nucleoside hydrolase [Campylobacter jejuni]